MKKQNTGFTLIELAIVLVIIGLLISVGVSLLPGLINQQKYMQNQSLLNRDYNTILGYIQANGQLPYASSDTNGIESSNKQNIGYLPYVTIGGLQKDAYGNTFYYAVNNILFNININGSTTSMNLENTNNISDFCKVLSVLNYYNNNPTLSSSDIRVINTSSQTPTTPVCFVIVSSGANNKLDTPNTITNSNGEFAGEQYPLSQTYDDAVKSLGIIDVIGEICQPLHYVYNVTYDSASNTYTVTSSGSSNSTSSTLSLSPSPGYFPGGTVVTVSDGSGSYTCNVITAPQYGYCGYSCTAGGSSITLTNTNSNQYGKCSITVQFTDSTGASISGTYTY